MYRIFTFSFLLLATTIYAQKIPLRRPINSGLTQEIAPSLSADGQKMVYMSLDNISKKWAMYYTEKKGGNWSKPTEIPYKNPDLLYLGGYSLTADGKRLYFTANKYGGVGNYDIWYMDNKGGYWDTPVNMAMPINSKGPDLAPSISPNGEELYFARCATTQTQGKAGCCELMVAKHKGKGIWEAPVALPSNINTGCVTAPRMLSDGKTLIFSAKTGGGKGGFDFYMTRKEGSGWTDPVHMDFMSTEEDDYFADVPAKGDVVFYDALEGNSRDVIMARIPAEFQPEKVLVLEGTVKDKNSGEPLDAFIELYDLDAKDLTVRTRPDKKTGEFFMIAPAGVKYDFSAMALDKSHFFHSNFYDLTDVNVSRIENIEVKLPALGKGKADQLVNTSFKGYTTNVNDDSDPEIRRIAKMLKLSPTTNIEIQGHLGEFLEDTVKSSPDMTETRQEVKLIIRDVEEKVMQERDSTITIMGADSVMRDSTFSYLKEVIVMRKDTVEKIITWYHNDRTQQEAEAIVNELKRMGVPSSRIRAKGYKDNTPLVAGDPKKNKRLMIMVY